MEDEFFTVTEAAKQLGISTPTVRRLIEQREITAMRSGLRKWVIPQSALLDYKRARLSEAKKPVTPQKPALRRRSGTKR